LNLPVAHLRYPSDYQVRKVESDVHLSSILVRMSTAEVREIIRTISEPFVIAIIAFSLLGGTRRLYICISLFKDHNVNIGTHYNRNLHIQRKGT